METQNYLNQVEGRKGQFIKLCWQRMVKTAAAFRNLSLEKKTTVTARTGIQYDNIATVQEKRETGELPPENAGLPWGMWKTFPFVIEHKGEDYARIYTVPNAKPEVEWYLNGKRITREVALTFLTPSDRAKANDHSKNECFTVKMNDLIEL